MRALRIGPMVCMAVLLLTVAWAQDAVETGSELAKLLGADADAGFAKATTPRRFSFPADHGPHNGFRNEWWYLTGNLEAENGRRFGFELTIFRFALAPPVGPSVAAAQSSWRSNQLYIAHFAVTDADGEQFFVAEKFSRAALGLAGAQAAPLAVWIDDWRIAETGANQWTVRASDSAIAIDLTLLATKPPVLNGIDGLSQKSAESGNASYYYSITRWQTAGRLRIGDDAFAVSGLSWLDREWSSSALADYQQGWDWFALQLSDDTDLMFYNIRQRDGSQDEHSAGTYVGADGTARYLARDQIEIVVTDTWASPQGGHYPSAWELSLPGEGLELSITPLLADQELFTTVRYWEGAVDVRGTRDGEPIAGRGYVELTGYGESAREK